jgi:probable addiction module antidote protein
MTVKLRRWEPAEGLVDGHSERLFLEEVAKDGDPREIADAIEIVAKARGMRALAAELGISPNRLFKLVNPYNDEFDLAPLQEAADRLMAGRPEQSDAA